MVPSRLRTPPPPVRTSPRTGELIYRCPLCGPEDRSGHLYLSPEEGVWHCYRCRSGGKTSWLVWKTGVAYPYNEGPDAATKAFAADALAGVVDDRVLALLRGDTIRSSSVKEGTDYARMSPNDFGWFSREAGDLFGLGSPQCAYRLGSMPDSWWECDLDQDYSFDLPWRPVFNAIRYVRSRGVDQARARAWRLFVPTDPCLPPTGKTRYGRLVIPAVHPRAGCVTSFMARSLYPNAYPRYLGPYTRSMFPSLIYSPTALTKASIGALHEAVLVEGPFDAMAVDKAGYDSIALSGKGLTDDGITILRESGVKLVIVMLDGDSATAWHGLARKLFKVGIDTLVTWLTSNHKDPGEMDEYEIASRLSEAIPAWQAFAAGFGQKCC